MLPSTPHVEATFLGTPNGILANAKHGGLFIDCSTIDPNNSKALHGAVAKAGGRMLDAPVSGGVTGAAAGTLTFMVGGEAGALEDARPILMDMGSNIVHCGPAGEAKRLFRI